MTSEQLEAARAERMRQNGLGTLTLEDARTWIEETGLCLFLPRRQFSSSIAPSFVEAIGGQRDSTPDPKQIAAAEELLVRLETDGVAVRLNLLGQPGEQPDFVVAAWVLPYVYALRGDRDWRRSPQLTGSRQVSPLAVQTYKLLEAGDLTIPQLKQSLGREVSEAAVIARHHRTLAAAAHHSGGFGSGPACPVAIAPYSVPKGNCGRRFHLPGDGDLRPGLDLFAGRYRREHGRGRDSSWLR